jgi:serine/threonine protein kinase
MWQELLCEDLDKYLNRVKLIDQNSWRDMSMQILDALKYLHGKNIVHRDLKPANIMWDKDHKTLKLIDFGLAKYCNIEQSDSDRDKAMCGTPLYTPPEIYDASPAKIHDLYKPSVDIWAFGIISFKCLSGLIPYFDEDEIYNQDLLEIRINKRVIPKEPLRKNRVDESIVHLITDKILNYDYQERITANNIVSDFLLKL